MNYIEFKKALANFTVFSLEDIKRVDSSFYRRRLNEWQDKGYIIKIIKGYYIFSDLELDEKLIFEIANRIYNPSYISFEMALSYYGLIPESVYGMTSASTRKTYRFKTAIAEFTYRSVSPRLFFGYIIERHKDRHFKIAMPEKAILDYFYLNPEIKDDNAYESLRINKDLFFKLVSRKKMYAFLEKFSQKSISRRIDSFWRFMKHA